MDIHISEAKPDRWLQLMQSAVGCGPEQAAGYWMTAYSLKPSRPEPLYLLAKQFRCAGSNEASMRLLDLAVPNKEEYEGRIEAAHSWGLAEEYLIVSFYCGKDGARDHMLTLMDGKGCPNSTVQGALSNYRFYGSHKLRSTSIPDKISNQTRTLAAQNGATVITYPSSPCIIKTPGAYLINQRLVSYKLLDEGRYDLGASGTVTTFNERTETPGDIEDDPSVVSVQLFSPPSLANLYNGLEDVKVWRKEDGALVYLATHISPNRDIRMSRGEYSKEGMSNPIVMEHVDHRGETEKNWAQCGDDMVVYKWSPLTVCKIDGSQISPVVVNYNVPGSFQWMRGSTNACLYQGRLWFLTHSVLHRSPRVYYNHFVVLDPETFRVMSYSAPFKLSDHPIEFCLGLVVEDNRVLIGYSEMDGSSKIARVDWEEINGLLVHL